MPIEVRQVEPSDAGAIAGIWNEIIQTGRYTALDTTLTVETQRKFITELPERGIFLVAEKSEDSGIVGFQVIEPFATYTHAFDHVGIISTCMSLMFRRRGVGRLLFESSLTQSKKQGYEKLFTYIRADNDAAQTFYRKLGFSKIGVACNHAKFGEQYIDLIIVEKFL
jgi:L-amino acid N-acyltransferase YncA